MEAVDRLLTASSWKWCLNRIACSPLARTVPRALPDIREDGKWTGPLGYLRLIPSLSQLFRSVEIDLLPHPISKRIWEQWDHVYKRFIRMAGVTLLSPITPSFLVSKVGIPRVLTSWGCFEVWVMNTTAHRIWLTYYEYKNCMCSIKILVESGAQIKLALWVSNIIEHIEFSIYTKRWTVVCDSPFSVLLELVFSTHCFIVRAVSACLLVWPGLSMLFGPELVLSTCLMNKQGVAFQWHWRMHRLWASKEGASRVFEPPL